MQFDVLHEVQAQVEAFVSSRVRQVGGDVDELDRCLKTLNDDVNERQGKLEQRRLDLILESARCASTLKQWTGKTTANVIFDSMVDEFTNECFFNKVKGRPNIAQIATTTDGDVFGGFYSVAVTEQWEDFQDPSMFIFSFESHGRCRTPQRFVVKEKWKSRACMRFFKDNCNGWFVRFDSGGGWFYLGYER